MCFFTYFVQYSYYTYCWIEYNAPISIFLYSLLIYDSDISIQTFLSALITNKHISQFRYVLHLLCVNSVFV